MKKITKIALALAASVFMGAAFVGCAEEAGETGNFGEDFALVNSKTKDDEAPYVRGYKTTKTKHTAAVAKITLPKPTSTADGGDGVIGMIFHVVENEDKSQSFGLIGTKRAKNGDIMYYISMFKNVDVDTKLNAKGNFCDINGVEANKGGSATEKQIVPTSGVWKKLTTASGDGDYVLYVVLEAGGEDTNDDNIVKEGEGDGSYEVSFTTETGYGKLQEAMKAKDEEEAYKAYKAYIAAVKDTAKIPASATGDTKATQYKLGMYTNVYAATSEGTPTTLKGRFDLIDTVNECEIELED